MNNKWVWVYLGVGYVGLSYGCLAFFGLSLVYNCLNEAERVICLQVRESAVQYSR